jgi:hypothetical protein
VRTPKARGKPIDARRIESWVERFDGYRVAITSQRVGIWFNNFKAQDKELGARILDAVTFLKSEDMDSAIRDIARRLPGWHKYPAQRRSKWRFVAFSISAGESGDTMLHRFRTALGLTGSRFNDLFIHKSDLLREGISADDTVVFIDDFAGTGEQACRAWRGDTKAGLTGLAELLPGNPKTYLVLIAAGKRAVDRITQETGLKVIARHVLSSGDDIFSAECQHFTPAEKDSLLGYCKRADRKIPRGFGDCGFVVVLAHKTPNNSIPVLHANHNRWRGLFPRH